MNLSQIISARKKIISNAEDLIVEADILYQKKRFPRSFALAHLACEELSKLPMLNTAALNVLIGEDTDWKSINKRLSSHIDKLRMSAGMDYLWSEVRFDDSDVKQFLDEVNSIPHFNKLKNASLYAGFHNGEFLQPKEVIEKDLANNMLILTKKRFVQYQATENALLESFATEEGKIKLSEMWRLVKKAQDALKIIIKEEKA